VIPAALQGFTVRPQWAVEFLKASVPGVVVPEPANPVVTQKSLPQGALRCTGEGHKLMCPGFPVIPVLPVVKILPPGAQMVGFVQQ